jgi:plastocyanin
MTIVAGACGGDAGGSGAAGAGATSVTATDNEFDPSTVDVTAGSTIEISNEGEATHNFSIDGEDVDVDIEPGDFSCKFHEKAGMTGTLRIEG